MYFLLVYILMYLDCYHVDIVIINLWIFIKQACSLIINCHQYEKAKSLCHGGLKGMECLRLKRIIFVIIVIDKRMKK